MVNRSISKIDVILSHWKDSPEIAENIKFIYTEPASPGNFFPFPKDLTSGLENKLTDLGIHQLYGHQLDTYLTIKQRKNVIITTGTASGKSLCYNLPVIDHLLKVPNARALFLFPTKALTHDQFEKLLTLTNFEYNNNLNPIFPAVYDGDTPASKRQSIRKTSRCLLSNPDMLHTAILPHHTKWEAFFRGLDYVVIDEIHTYRGVFGSHIANVIRRLKRIARFYGSSPIFILTSATIANPEDHGRALIEDEIISIHQDDAPRGEKTTILYNPPVMHQETGIRKSASSEIIKLGNTLLDNGVQILAFSRSRRGVEMLLRQLRLSRKDDPSLFQAYRSGYLATDRRRIERNLRDGTLRAVAATNALELGVDIGGMDAVLMTGFPGTIAGMRQQSGRAGRKAEPSLALLVATGSPIDQYLMRHPEFLIGKSPESVMIDPNHPVILLGHLQCAAFELPFTKREPFGNLDLDLLIEYLDYLSEAGTLHQTNDKYFWTNSAYPANDLSLRSTDSKSIVLHYQSEFTFKTLGEIDYSSALWMVHPGAIYLHEGETYYVDSLNLEKSEAIIRDTDVDYFTDPVKKITISKINELENTNKTGSEITFGEINITTEISGFKKILWSTREILSVEHLSLPPTTMRTTAYWISLSEETVTSLRESSLWNNDPNFYGYNWDIIRTAVRQRDQFRCQACGIPESGKAHNVHHKTPLRVFVNLDEANKLENLITLCPTCHQLAEANVKMRSGLAGLGYAISQIAPLFLMCDTSDIGTLTDPICTLSEGQPAIILYDQVNAGIGLSKKCFELHETILENIKELISNCECADGCPSCVGPGGENGVGGKLETLAILDYLSPVSQTYD